MSRVQLPDAPWRQSDTLRAVVAALTADGSSVRIVGGAVRDGLLGLPVSDVDLATPMLPQDVIERLEKAKIKAIPTGLEHGTITAFANGQNIEITTLRRDVSTDGRRATVDFSSDWREDAARRDFTINALYADPETGEIFDYFGGFQELLAGHVRFIGDADTRIAEDHLRILRFFRFNARFGKGAPDDDAISACSSAASSLMALSRERIQDELSKILALPDPLSSIELMMVHGIFAAFLPEIRSDAVSSIARLLNREQAVLAQPKSGRRMNAILPCDANVTEKVGARLKMSKRQKQDLMTRARDGLAVDGDPASAARQLAYRLDVELARDICLLHGRDESWRAAYQALSDWNVPSFPVSGGQLIARGLSAGPDVAACLKKIEKAWIDEGFPDASRALEIADQLVAETLSKMKE